MKKKKIIIFTNNERSLNIIKNLVNKFDVKLIVLSKKFLNLGLIKKIRGYKIQTLFFEEKKSMIIHKIKDLNPDFIICAGFPKIIPKKILDIPKFCSINLHGGKVPTYLGGSPINWQIINGEKNLFISALKMNTMIDGGPLIAQKSIKIDKNLDFAEIKDKVNLFFPKICLTAINKVIKKNKLKYYSLEKKIFWKQRKKKDSKIFINKSKKLEAHNIIRASSPKYYPAFIISKNKKILLLKSFLNKKLKINSKKTILIHKNKLFIKFKDGFLLIKKFRIL